LDVSAIDEIDGISLAGFLKGPARADIADEAARERRNPFEGGDRGGHRFLSRLSGRAQAGSACGWFIAATAASTSIHIGPKPKPSGSSKAREYMKPMSSGSWPSFAPAATALATIASTSSRLSNERAKSTGLV